MTEQPESTAVPTLVVLAAGLSTRYGAVKPLAPVGPSGEALIDYALYDAARSGYGGAILVVHREIEAEVSGHVEDVTGGSWPCRFVCQSADELPDGARSARGRTKPWGTGHAVWTVRHLVRGPFAVVNADDFYGRGALQVLADHLRSAAPREYVAVTYRLADTLSGATRLSRAILEVGARDRVQGIREVLRIHHGSAGISGESPTGSPVSLSGEEPASMGIWGFDTTIFPLLEARFRAFLGRAEDERPAEFYLSDTLNGLVVSGDVRMRAVGAVVPAFGVTFPDDRSEVRSRIEALVADGHYPVDLASAFRELAIANRPSGTEP